MTRSTRLFHALRPSSRARRCRYIGHRSSCRGSGGAQFEMRQDPAVVVDRGAGAGAERQHISTPSPLIAPKPSTSASFITRTGFSTACRARLQIEAGPNSVPRWGRSARARCAPCRESRHETRSKRCPSCAAAFFKASTSTSGRPAFGVSAREGARRDFPVAVEEREFKSGAADIDGEGPRICHPSPVRASKTIWAQRYRGFPPAPTTGLLRRCVRCR